MRHFGMPPGYDRYKLATPPEYDDAYFGIEPEEEELPEPTIEDVWHPTRAEYVTTCTFANGKKFTVHMSSFPSDSYEIRNPKGEVISDGHVTPEKALDHLLDLEWDR